MLLQAKDLSQVASKAGFKGVDLMVAVAVALAESAGNSDAHGDTALGSGSGSIGLWQIYLDAHPEYGDGQALYDPQANADAAYKIYQAARNSFLPWSTFKNGAFTTFMHAAWQGVTQS